MRLMNLHLIEPAKQVLLIRAQLLGPFYCYCLLPFLDPIKGYEPTQSIGLPLSSGCTHSIRPMHTQSAAGNSIHFLSPSAANPICRPRWTNKHRRRKGLNPPSYARWMHRLAPAMQFYVDCIAGYCIAGERTLSRIVNGLRQKSHRQLEPIHPSPLFHRERLTS